MPDIPFDEKDAHIVAVHRGFFFDPLQNVDKIRVIDLADDDADLHAVIHFQALGDQIGMVIEFLCSLFDPFDDFRTGFLGMIEYIGYGRDRNAGVFRNVLSRTHSSAHSVSSCFHYILIPADISPPIEYFKPTIVVTIRGAPAIR